MAWEVKKLGDVCDLITDGVHNSPPYVDIGIPMLDSKHIDNSFQIDDSNPTKFISEETDQLLSQRCKPKENDILISSRGSIGKIAIVRKGQNFNIMGNIILLRLPKSLDTKFLVYSLHSELKKLESIAKGVAQKGLYLNQVRSFPISLPPLPEQKRIVAILDEAFESIEKAKENAEKNLKNANEIFESYLQSLFENKGEGWEEKTLGDFLKLEYGKPLDKSKRKSEGKYPVYGANGEKDRTDEFYHDKISIIIGRKGSAGEINFTEGKFWPLDVTYFITFDDNKYSLNFIYYLLSRLKLPSLAKGVKPGINRNEVYSINVQIPSLNKQQAIVTKLDALSTETKKVKAIYTQKLADLEDLKNSILQKAFDGELK